LCVYKLFHYLIVNTKFKIVAKNFKFRTYIVKLKIKSVAYSSQRNHTGQLDFCMVSFNTLGGTFSLKQK